MLVRFRALSIPFAACLALAIDQTQVVFAATSPLLSPQPRSSPVSITPPMQEIGSVHVATGAAHKLHTLPVPVSIRTQGSADRAAFLTSDALLATLPGFDRARSNGGFSNYGLNRISFTGAGNDRGAIFVDGVPAQDAFGGQVDWAAYPAEDIERAELLRGSGSSLYGSGAIGGALDIATFSPRDGDTGLNGEMSAGLGTNAARSLNIRVRGPLAPHWDASVYARTDTMSYPDLPPAYSSSHDTPAISQNDTSNLHLRYHAGNTTIDSTALESMDSQQEGRPNYLFHRTLGQYAIHIAQQYQRSSINLFSYQRQTAIYNVADQFPTAPGKLRYDQFVPTNENGLRMVYTFGTLAQTQIRADMKSVFGTNYQVGPTGTVQSNVSGDQHLAGLAFQQTMRAPRTELVLGGRADTVNSLHNTLESSALSPRVAARYDLSSNTAIRASIGEGFRAPYLNELIRSYVIGTVTYAPNAHLSPEHSSSSALGFDAVSHRLHASLDLTDTVVNNAIGFITQSTVLQQEGNFGRTRTDSVIAAGTMRLGSCSDLHAAYTTQYARVVIGSTSDIAKRLAYIPARQFQFGIDGHIFAVSGGLDILAIGRTYADDLNSEPLDPATIVNAHISRVFANGTHATLMGENIGGAHYLSSIDRYGIPPTVSFMLSVPFGQKTRVTHGCSALVE